MAQVLAWLGIPVLATLAAIVWVMWTSRPRARQDVSDSVAGYERFKAALAQASSSGDPASRQHADDDQRAEQRAPVPSTSSESPPTRTGEIG
jgi:outer membrane lipoprotein-sorting protein